MSTSRSARIRPHVDAIHPFGKIPVMRHGDVTLCELKAIATYIDRVFDGPKVIPEDPKRAAQVEQWVSLGNVEFDKADDPPIRGRLRVSEGAGQARHGGDRRRGREDEAAGRGARPRGRDDRLSGRATRSRSPTSTSCRCCSTRTASRRAKRCSAPRRTCPPTWSATSRARASGPPRRRRPRRRRASASSPPRSSSLSRLRERSTPQAELARPRRALPVRSSRCSDRPPLASGGSSSILSCIACIASPTAFRRPGANY